VTPSRRVTPERKKTVGEFTKNSGQTWSDSEINKSDSGEQKRSSAFSGKIGVTPLVAAPDDTNPVTPLVVCTHLKFIVYSS